MNLQARIEGTEPHDVHSYYGNKSICSIEVPKYPKVIFFTHSTVGEPTKREGFVVKQGRKWGFVESIEGDRVRVFKVDISIMHHLGEFPHQPVSSEHHYR